MVPVKAISIKAHGTLVFAPGGYHLMCMKPTPDIKSKQQVRVTLEFADGATVSGDFRVRGARN